MVPCKMSSLRKTCFHAAGLCVVQDATAAIPRALGASSSSTGLQPRTSTRMVRTWLACLFLSLCIISRVLADGSYRPGQHFCWYMRDCRGTLTLSLSMLGSVSALRAPHQCYPLQAMWPLQANPEMPEVSDQRQEVSRQVGVQRHASVD